MFTGAGMRKEDRHKVDLDTLEEICPRPPTTDPVEGEFRNLWPGKFFLEKMADRSEAKNAKRSFA